MGPASTFYNIFKRKSLRGTELIFIQLAEAAFSDQEDTVFGIENRRKAPKIINGEIFLLLLLIYGADQRVSNAL